MKGISDSSDFVSQSQLEQGCLSLELTEEDVVTSDLLIMFSRVGTLEEVPKRGSQIHHIAGPSAILLKDCKSLMPCFV